MRSLLWALFCLPALSLPAAPVIGRDIPPFGVQGVWANDASLEESLDLMQAAGVRVARTDLIWWNLAEREPGVFNFTSPDYPGYQNWNTDRLVEMMHARDIEPYAILCYGNALYDNEEGPHTPEARAAFARYCGEAAARYRDSITIWEIWNEPNLDEYWSGGTDPNEYAPLAIEAAQAIREANPEAIIVGPALSWLTIHEGMIDRWCEWLEVCGQHGLYDHVDAISIHPYRVGVMPESINPELAHIREIIARHTDRDIAIWTGEWGYNTIWTEVDEIEQAKYLPRQFLNNMSQGVEMSIWFSFKPMEGWGMVEEGPDGYVPRPAYRSFQVLADLLGTAVRHIEDPFGVQVFPMPDNLRIQVFEAPRSPAVSRHIVALWLEQTADSEFESLPVSVQMSSAEWVISSGPNADVIVMDGLNGSFMVPVRSMEEGMVVLSERDGAEIRVSDYPIYLVLTKHSR